MKKFFKNLALVLALVLIVGSLPMAQAKAAEPELKKTAKSLYVGGSIGQTEDGVKSPVLKSAKVAGFVANAGEAKITAKSADKTIAKVKYGRIYAVAPGATKVTVYADGEEIGTIDVTVKKNSTEVAINNAPETITVGKTYDLDRDKNGVGDHTSYVVVEGKATVDAKGNLVATAAGDVKVKVYAYQSKTYSKATAESEVVTIKAVPGVEKAAQTSKNTIALTCVNKESAAAIAKEDVVVYTKIGETRVNTIVKSVAATENVATVTFFADLNAKEKYYVEVAGKIFDVTIPVLEDKDAYEIKIYEDNYNGGEDIKLAYKVFTEDGIDMTDKFTLSPAFSTSDFNVAWLSSSNPTMLTFIGDAKFGATATVVAKATVRYLDADSKYQEKVVSGAATFTYKDYAQASYAGVVYTVADAAGATVDASKAVHSVPLGTTKYLNAVLNSTKDGKAEPAQSVDGIKYKFETVDSSVLIVAADGRLLPVKIGTAQVLIRKESDKSVIDVVTVEVTAAVNPTASYKHSVNKNRINSTGASFDSATITVKAVSNYNDETAATIKSVSFEVAGKNIAKSQVDVNISGAGEITVKPNTKGIEGSAIVTFVVSDTYTKTEYFTFSPKETATTYAVEAKAADKSSKVNVAIVSESGMQKSDDVQITVTASSQDDGYTVNSGVTVTGFVSDTDPVVGNLAFKVYKGDVDVTEKVTTSQSAIITARKAGGDDTKKLAAGEYTVILYMFTAASKDTVKVVARTTFTVVDTQPTLSATQKNITCSVSPATSDFTVMYDGKEVTANLTLDVTPNGDYFVVTAINYTVPNTGGYVATVKGTWVFKKN